MNVLAIESSCDETSIAILSNYKLTSNLISSQDFHVNYGGVVPELSSRAHLQIIIPLIRKALVESKLKLPDIDLIAATAGPGLIGALLVGLTFAKGLSYSLQRPFVAVDHIEAHIFSGFLMEEKPEFPYLCLVVSGGHTLLMMVESDTKIRKLGSTTDDAAGEAFDKGAKMIGLGYPGGPLIELQAEKGDPGKIIFPVAQCKNEFDFSFSGLKTSLLRYIQKSCGHRAIIPAKDIPDLAASYQNAIVTALQRNTEKALNEYDCKSISLVGGVAANKCLRESLTHLAQKTQKRIIIPDLEYCGDNAAMIAYRGMKLHQNGETYSLDFNAYPGILKGAYL